MIDLDGNWTVVVEAYQMYLTAYNNMSGSSIQSLSFIPQFPILASSYCPFVLKLSPALSLSSFSLFPLPSLSPNEDQ